MIGRYVLKMVHLTSISKKEEFTLKNVNDTIKFYTQRRRNHELNWKNACNSCKPNKCDVLCDHRRIVINKINMGLKTLKSLRTNAKNKKFDDKTINKMKRIIKLNFENPLENYQAKYIEHTKKRKKKSFQSELKF